jgi:hypothetical protein
MPMGVLNFLDKLRRKPEMARRRILVGTTFGITGFIFLVWVTTTFYGLETISDSEKIAGEKGPIVEAGEVLSSFFDKAKADMASVQAVLATTSLATNTPSSVSPNDEFLSEEDGIQFSQ